MGSAKFESYQNDISHMKSRLTQDERTAELELRVKELEKQVANLKMHLSNSPTLATRKL